MNKELKHELKEGSQVTRYIMIRIVIACIILGFLGTGVGLAIKFVNTNAEREIFKQSVAYNEGVLDDLAQYKLEMIQANDEIAKTAIANMVVDRFANYDESKIESDDLKEFLSDCRNLEIENY